MNEYLFKHCYNNCDVFFVIFDYEFSSFEDPSFLNTSDLMFDISSSHKTGGRNLSQKKRK